MPQTGNCKIFYILIYHSFFENQMYSLYDDKVAFKQINPIYQQKCYLAWNHPCPLYWDLIEPSQMWCPMNLEETKLMFVHSSHVSTFLVYGDKRQKDNLLMGECIRVASKQVMTGPWCDWWLHNIISLTAARFNKHGLHHHQPPAGSRMENVKQPTLLSLTRFLWRYLCSLYLYLPVAALDLTKLPSWPQETHVNYKLWTMQNRGDTSQ